MASTSRSLVNYLRVMVESWRHDPRDDATLLTQFAENGEETAFRVLVGRHGPLVWQTCRRMLGDTPDAEDAFQTTFVTLARKAKRFTIKNPAAWLHQVARQTALNARASVRRRRLLEQRRRAETQPTAAAEEDVSRAELYAVLDEEVANLPERLRVPLVLRYLEGKTLAEVARILGCSLSPLIKRLGRGEALLRKRLERRGLEVDIVSVGALLGSTAALSSVPAGLMGSTVRAAAALHSGTLPGGTAESARAVLGALPSSVETTILRKSLWIVLVCFLGLGGAALVACRSLGVRPGEADATDPATGQSVEQPRPNGRAAARVDCHGDPLPPGALARLGTLRLRHPGWVHSVAFSPDGKTVASAGDVVRLWDAISGKEIRTLPAHQGEVWSVAFSPDGRTMASGGVDRRVCLWETVSGKQIRTLQGHERMVCAVAFSPDGRVVASAGGDAARLWDALSGKQIRALSARQGKVRAVAFSPDGKTVASGGDDGELRLWDAASGEEYRTLKGAETSNRSIAFSPDGKTVASGGDDGTVHLWDAASGKELRTLKGHNREVMSVVFSPDGKIVASAGHDDGVRLWEAATGKKIPSPKWSGEMIVGAAFSPDGKTMVSGGWLGVVRLWETVTDKETIRMPEGHEGSVLGAAFLTDGKTVITGGQDGMVRLWEMASGKELRTLWGGAQRLGQLGGLLARRQNRRLGERV